MDRQRATLESQLLALVNAGKWTVAETRLEAALKIYSSDLAFLELMGITKLNLKKPKDAIKFLKKALVKAPKNVGIHLNLAAAHMMLEALPAAQATILKALKLDPRSADAWMMQGDIHTKKDRTDKAVECYKKAVNAQPDGLKFNIKLLMLLETLNKIEELEIQLEVFERSVSDHPIVTLFKGIVCFRNAEYKLAKDYLNSFTFENDKYAQFRRFELMRTRYLGLTCDELHLEAEAVSAFKRSKVLNRMFADRPAPPDVYWKACEMRENYYSAEVSASWQTKSSCEDEPVFLIGFPRSGTTLLDTFLRGQKGLALLEEKPAVAKLRAELGTSLGHDISIMNTVEQSTLSAARKAYFDELKSHKLKGLVIDKLPMNLVSAGEILRVFPRAKFILALRDPADAVLSCFMQVFDLNPAMATLDSPEDAAKTYAHSMQIWKQTVEALSPAFVTTRYEDLISDPEKAIRPVLSFLGVEWDDDILDHQKTAQNRGRINTPSRSQVVKPLYTTSMARWERYADHMPEAMKILAPWRKEYGYSD